MSVRHQRPEDEHVSRISLSDPRTPDANSAIGPIDKRIK